jgi:1-hydroxycarotenoid 3,4-desaturase
MTTSPGDLRVTVVGAGIAGLTAAIQLAACGARVTLFERANRPGGKIRQVKVGGHLIDAGPTVLTMRWVFERLFEEAGSSLSNFITTTPAEVLCRHAWQDGSRLDLFADRDRSIDAIGQFAGPKEAAGYRRFALASERLYKALAPSFIDAAKPGPVGLAAGMALADPRSLFIANPLNSLWQELGHYFSDPRLGQLFGRYATYSGASPFQASATLMLISHVEAAGIWTVKGGMIEVANALDRLARTLGVTMHYGRGVERLETQNGRIAALLLEDGDRVATDAVVLNADSSALSQGLMGPDVDKAVTAATTERSLSAIATCLVATPQGLPLSHHNVCFSKDYRTEFEDIFKRGRLPRDPTVYICAQNRVGGLAHEAGSAGHNAEPALLLVNAPPNGDRHSYQPTEIEECWERTLAVLRRCGLTFAEATPSRQTTTPSAFHQMFPGTGGALYGRSSHGWAAAFRRPGNRSAIPGLYLAGGSVHPGAGVPMAALSGRQAAANLLADRASIRRFHPVATSGGTSTH